MTDDKPGAHEEDTDRPIASRAASYFFVFNNEKLSFRSAQVEAAVIIATFLLPLLLLAAQYLGPSPEHPAERIWNIYLALAIAVPVIAFFWGRDATVGYALFAVALLALWHLKNYEYFSHMPIVAVAGWALVWLAARAGNARQTLEGELERWKLRHDDLESELHLKLTEEKEIAGRQSAIEGLAGNLARLARASAEVERSLSLPKVAATVAEQAHALFGHGRALVYQFRGDQSVLLSAAPPCAPGAESGDDFNFIVRRRRQNTLIADLDRNYQFQPQFPPVRSFRSFLAVPLIVEHKVWGILRLEADKAGELGRDDLGALSSLAVPAALALHNADLFAALELRAVTDGLTGLYRRHYFDRRLDTELARARRLKAPLSLVFLDVDHFKSINDRYGHTQGDAVLRAVAERTQRHVKSQGIVARYGGEEFVAILPETSVTQAARVAEVIRAVMARDPISGSAIQVTVSCGVAAFPEHGSTPTELTERADAALYAAKRGGRNRVVVAT